MAFRPGPTSRGLLAAAAGLLLAGCGFTGMHAERRDLTGLPRLQPGTRLISPLVRPPVPSPSAQTLRSPLRALSRIGQRDLFFAPSWINGRRADLLIDTGAPLTGLTADFARAARVPISAAMGEGAFAHDAEIPHTFAMHWARADRFRLGKWSIGPRTLTVSDHAFFFRVVGVPVVRASGVLGMDVLQHFRLTFDYERGTCRLDNDPAPAPAAASLPLTINRRDGTPRPLLTLRVNDRLALPFLPDSGASGHGVLAASAWDRLRLAGPVARIRLQAEGIHLGEVAVVRGTGEFSILPLAVLADDRGRVTLDFPRGRVSLPRAAH